MTRSDEEAFQTDGERITEDVSSDARAYISQQVDLARFPLLHRHTTPATDLAATFSDNAAVWKQFNDEHLYDTRRVTLEHFHLFEWFPQAPGVFHTDEGEEMRYYALRFWEERQDRGGYFTVDGKVSMLSGGVGAVRLLPRQLQGGEPYYFMTASSTGICHEGFPVVVPRRYYGAVKQQIQEYGAAPATIRGEMRYIPEDVVNPFRYLRNIPLLYLHVDDLQLLPRPRDAVTSFRVSGVVLFASESRYAATYATFDPASAESIEQACTWMQDFYVKGLYQGTVVTDFDEVRPRFRRAAFALPHVMSGQIDPDQVPHTLRGEHTHKKITIYNYYVAGDYINGHITVGDVSGENIRIGHGSAS